MATKTLALVLALAFTTAAPASAQTIDLAALGNGLIGLPTAIETDGNPATQEWLVTQLFSSNRRIVRVTAQGAVCQGPRFVLDGSWTLQTLSGLTVATRVVWPYFTVQSLAPYAPTTC
jgi:hypothetical protein